MFFYGAKQALFDITRSSAPTLVTAFIGPSGCGKSTFLRTLNRMNDLIPGTRVEGQVLARRRATSTRRGVDLVELRAQSAWCFRSRTRSRSRSSTTSPSACASTGWPANRAALDDVVEQSLRSAALWDEVKDRLHDSALALSGGQQQRLCIARALAIKPKCC